jgi:hypothetical protein
MTRQKSYQQKSTVSRKPAHLTSKLDASLFGYAIAATAAGVGMLAMPQADAEVVATPANISIPHGGGVIQFDINRDGQMDFGLSFGTFLPVGHHRKTCSSNCPPPSETQLTAIPAQAANEIWQTGSKAGFFGSDIYCAAALAPGRRVGPAAKFSPGDKNLFWYYANFATNQSACRWGSKAPRNSYMGVKFLDTAGNLHYGWVRVAISSSITITGYAYETTPNVGINTGVTHGPVGDAQMMEPLAPGSAPASLGMLALGAPGLVAWRRAEEEESQRPV